VLEVGRKADDLALQKSEQMKTGSNLLESSKEGYCSENVSSNYYYYY
jgi:hypothetical protein